MSKSQSPEPAPRQQRLPSLTSLIPEYQPGEVVSIQPRTKSHFDSLTTTIDSSQWDYTRPTALEALQTRSESIPIYPAFDRDNGDRTSISTAPTRSDRSSLASSFTNYSRSSSYSVPAPNSLSSKGSMSTAPGHWSSAPVEQQAGEVGPVPYEFPAVSSMVPITKFSPPYTTHKGLPSITSRFQSLASPPQQQSRQVGAPSFEHRPDMFASSPNQAFTHSTHQPIGDGYSRSFAGPSSYQRKPYEMPGGLFNYRLPGPENATYGSSSDGLLPSELRQNQYHPHHSMPMESKAKRRRGNLPKSTTLMLKTWLFDHAHHPYPAEDEKNALAAQTGLSMNQISNWFINARRRILQPQQSTSTVVESLNMSPWQDDVRSHAHRADSSATK